MGRPATRTALGLGLDLSFAHRMCLWLLALPLRRGVHTRVRLNEPEVRSRPGQPFLTLALPNPNHKPQVNDKIDALNLNLADSKAKLERLEEESASCKAGTPGEGSRTPYHPCLTQNPTRTLQWLCECRGHAPHPRTR